MTWMRTAFLLTGCGAWLGSGTSAANAQAKGPKLTPSIEYQAVEQKLNSLATPLPKPAAGDWLAKHKEYGENFDQYLRSDPVRKSAARRKIYICLVGEFTPKQQEILDLTLKYLECFYQVPVEIKDRVPLAKIPEHGRRKHPRSGEPQVLTTYILRDVLVPQRPEDALAYLAFTAEDLFPDHDWNFVYGQASLRDRVGVWSIHRMGYPAESDAEYRLCLTRTMKVAAHETGHILGLVHCIAHHCGMNGSNHRDEMDRAPLLFCPLCLRKLCWNLQAEPAAYIGELEKFYRQHDFKDEADQCAAMRAKLTVP